MRRVFANPRCFLAVAQPMAKRWAATSEEKPAAEEPLLEGEAKGLKDKITKMEKELKEANERIADLKKDYLYSMAEADNARRIGREDTEKARNFGVTSFGKDMLDVVDVLERAVESFAMVDEEILKNKQIASIVTGVRMSENVLLKNLARHGIEKMEVEVGSVFNPNFHDALFKAPVSDKAPADHIASVLKPGYMIKGRVLRAAQVGVAE